MKRLIALTLALILLAGCTAPAEEVPAATPDVSNEPSPSVEPTQLPEPTLPFEFGELSASYSPYSVSRFTVDCYGDTSLLDAKFRLFGENNETGSIMFSFTAHEPIALTTALYDGGELVDEPLDCKLGYIERMEGGEWTHYTHLGAPYFEPQMTLPYRVVEGEFSERFAFYTFDEYGRSVSYVPGSYRITLYFRKSLDASAENFTTGDGLYSIQLLFFIPEASETQFDLVNVGFINSYEHDRTFGIVPFIRRNEAGATIYIDHARTRLEVLEGDAWVEATPREGMASAVENLFAEDSSSRYVSVPNNFAATVYVGDRDADYRIVYEYCENADGSGERGTLTIPLDFSLPKDPNELTIEMMESIGRSEAPATRAHSAIYEAGLGEHPSFGGSFITDDYHLGVNVKGGDPEFKAAVLEAVEDPSVIQFVETNASFADLEAQQEAFHALILGEDGIGRENFLAMGLKLTESGIRTTESAVTVYIFAKSKAAFDEFIELYGDQLGENVYFTVDYGFDLAEVAVHPDDAPPPPPEVVDDWGITLVASNVTRTSATVTFHRGSGILDDTGRNPITGAGWDIDVWDGDEWVTVPRPSRMVFAIGYGLGEFDINWEQDCGVLPPGYYRICKSASTAAPNYESRNYYAQFTITESTPEALSSEE